MTRLFVVQVLLMSAIWFLPALVVLGFRFFRVVDKALNYKIFAVFTCAALSSFFINLYIYYDDNIIKVEADLLSCEDIKGYPLISDKKYSVAATVEYEFHGEKKEYIAEIDKNIADQPSITLPVNAETGKVVNVNNLYAVPLCLVLSIAAMFYFGAKVEKHMEK